MSEEPLEHWPTDRMILGGHADVATQEDLEGMSDERLREVASICSVQELAPDECIPCLAMAMYADRKRKQLEEMNPQDPNLGDSGEMDFRPEDEEGEVIPELLDQAERVQAEDKPVAEQFAAKVAELKDLVDTLLHGDPIPPPNVSLAELGLLVLAAQKWIQITEVQGVQLSPPQQAMFDSTKALVARLRNE